MSHPFRNHLATISPNWHRQQKENLQNWRQSFAETADIIGDELSLVEQAIFVPLASTLSIAKIVASGEQDRLYVGSALTMSAFHDLHSSGFPVDGAEIGGFTRADRTRRAATIILRPAVSFTPFERRLCAAHELRHAQLLTNDLAKGIDAEADRNQAYYSEEIIAYASAAPIADAELQGRFTPIVAKAAAFMIVQDHPFHSDIREILDESKDVSTALQSSSLLWQSFRAITAALVAQERQLSAKDSVTFAEILTGQKHEVKIVAPSAKSAS